MFAHTLQSLCGDFREIFNFQDENAKGRTLFLLSNNIISTVASVFVSSAFYNGFLNMYGISTTGVSILNYVPYFAASLSLFSPCVLKYFKRRKLTILIVSLLSLTISTAATTLMPFFVIDPAARLRWLVALTLLANLISAPFNPAGAQWLMNFYPSSTEQRSRYFQYVQIISNALTLILVLVSSIALDALNTAANQGDFIITMRWLAYGLSLLSIAIKVFIFEPTIEDQKPVYMRDIFIKPVHNRKFLACMLLNFCWLLGSGINSVWMFHLQTHLHFSYTLTNLCFTWMAAFCNMIFVVPWRRVIVRFSWVKTTGISFLLLPVVDVVSFFITGDRPLVLFLVSFFEFAFGVGSSLGLSNFLYLNLPDGEDATPYISFYTLGTNLCTFIAYSFASWITSFSGDTPFLWNGLEIYSLQFCWFIRAATALGCGLVALLKWRSFTPDSEIARVQEITPGSYKKEQPT